MTRRLYRGLRLNWGNCPKQIKDTAIKSEFMGMIERYPMGSRLISGKASAILQRRGSRAKTLKLSKLPARIAQEIKCLVQHERTRQMAERHFGVSIGYENSTINVVIIGTNKFKVEELRNKILGKSPEMMPAAIPLSV